MPCSLKAGDDRIYAAPAPGIGLTFARPVLERKRLEPAVAFLRLLDGHQVSDLDLVSIDVDEIERGERSPYMKPEYLHTLCIQALFISPATGIWIGL